MHKTYVTFGQDHVHRVNSQTFDCNCVAVIYSPSPDEGRALAFEFFGPKFAFEYPEAYWDEKSMHYYPRGYVEVNQ